MKFHDLWELRRLDRLPKSTLKMRVHEENNIPRGSRKIRSVKTICTNFPKTGIYLWLLIHLFLKDGHESKFVNYGNNKMIIMTLFLIIFKITSINC